MKLVYNLLKILAVIVTVFAVALFSASFFLQDKIAGIVIRSFNEKISTKYDFGSVRLSFLRKFPNASLDLKNVMVHSSPGFDISCFAEVNTDTLLWAKSVSLEFKITDIIKRIYNIQKIGIKDGRLFLLSDTSGKVNYRIAVENLQDTTGDFVINLDRIDLQDLDASYFNLSTNLTLEGYIESSRLKSRITGEKIDFNADGSLRIDLFKLYDFKIAKSISTLIDVTLHDTGSGTLFDKSTISFDGYNFGLSGSVSSGNVLDLHLSGENIDISGIRNYLPERYSKRLSEYNQAGTLTVAGRITGPVSSTVNPGIEISFKLENGSVASLNSLMTIRDLSLDCLFNNGDRHIPASSILTISNFRGKLGSAHYTGSSTIKDFSNPEITVFLEGRIIPAELKDFFNLREITSGEGNIDINLRMHGFTPKKDKYSVRDILNLDPVGDLHFNAFGIGLKKNNIFLNKVNGDLFISDSLKAKNLSFNWRGHYFTINGIFMNLPEWLMGDPVILTAKADANCKKLVPEILFPLLFSKDTSNTDTTAFSFPGDIVLDLNFTTDEVSYKNFNAGRVTGTVSYKPRIINFKTLTFNSLEGIISGNGFVVQNIDKSFVGRGTFTLVGINVKQAFNSFNNFGQDFIKAENLNGKLSGTLSLLMPMDSLIKPVIKSLSVEGKYILANGNLMNFEPVKSLSSFIELSELENIHFEKLENDFFIKKNILYIPQMDINSSAADFTVSGQHSFENDYEYHMKILLSELLSKKLKKPKPNTSEFGAVKDDGLGRTSVLLKIEDRGDDVKVGYDVKAASNGVKSSIKAERENLRTILNQEYGWFKNDTSTKQTQSSGTPRFKIKWGEEADTVNEETPPPPVKKDNPLRNIFKKK